MQTSITKAVASALSFAHLAGIGGRAKARAKAEDDDDDKKDAKAESEEDDDDADDDKKKSKAKAKASDDEDDDDSDKDAKASEDDEDDDDKKDSKAARGKAAKAEDADDSDDEMRGKSAVAQARRREQARCASIFSSSAAASNPVLAANLAFKTRMPRDEAIAMLEATPAPAAAVPMHEGRSARNPSVGAGSAKQISTAQAAASSWDKAFAKQTAARQ